MSVEPKTEKISLADVKSVVSAKIGTVAEEQIDGQSNTLGMTPTDYLEATTIAETLSLEQTISMCQETLAIHKTDPNFPHDILIQMIDFLENPDIPLHPENHLSTIHAMKLQAALITNNSPYAEVRAVVSNHDDPATPAGTLRAWSLGILFSILLAAINQLFDIRKPKINIEGNVAQLLAYPMGKAWERWMPDVVVKVPGTPWEVAMNPGPFNKKEHMLIAIMANSARSLPYTHYIIWTQFLPQYFNQSWAANFLYRLLIALSANFIGYGLAGLTRRFLVYPAYCVWPTSLVTIALNAALHHEENTPVLGPGKRWWAMSRFRVFMMCFAGMFVYFWLPNYLFEVLTYFSWITWISPDNVHLNIFSGFRNGMGFNPLPSFDWNVMTFDGLDPLMVPFFSTINRTLGMFFIGISIIVVYYTNTWNTGYLPINTNAVFDHFGNSYNVSRVIGNRGMFDLEKYMNYSAPYMGAANCIVYLAFFAVYSASVMHVALFHRYEIKMGFKNLWGSLLWKKTKEQRKKSPNAEYNDVHNRLMSAYPEVSELWYFAILLIAIACGIAGIAAYPTYTTPGVVPYGIALCLIFVIPIGIIYAITGIPVTLNVLAEFIGGSWVQGNALAMNFFKTFGYTTCSHAISFTNDLKLAHYLHIPPRQTFATQLVATLISTLVVSGVLAIQLQIPNVCTSEAPMRFTCPGPTTFFTAAVLWGTVGPIKVFGPHGQYGLLLLGFPLGVVSVLLFYLLTRLYPRSRAIRQLHPVALWYGGLNWSPYSFSYAWPAVPIAAASWLYVRKRYLAFWSKYNFVLSASFSAGIAIAGIVMLFSVQWAEVDVDWWGNEQPYKGCEGTVCTLKQLNGGRFYPWWDGKKVPAP